MQQQAQRLGISDEEMLQRYVANISLRSKVPALIYATCTALGALAWFHTKTRLLA